MRTCSCAFSALLLAVAIGCAKEAEIDDPPDLSRLARTYDHPDGVVDPPTVNASFAAAVTIAGVASVSGLGPFLRDSYDRLRQRATQLVDEARNRSRLNEDDVKIDLNLELRRVCNGWTNPNSGHPDEDRNGAVSFRGVVRNDGTLPTVWGSTIGTCRQTTTLQGQSMLLVIDGGVAMYGSSIDRPLLVAVDGTFGSASGTVAGAHDLRLLSDGQIEVRVPAATGGSVIVFASGDETGVRGSNGTFRCDQTTHICTGPSGQPEFQW